MSRERSWLRAIRLSRRAAQNPFPTSFGSSPPLPARYATTYLSSHLS
ncbi:hypothetical protein KNP414_01067 [Paenibacillus mucilaginosus KNP414]|uniref:Uncharacterized protein n=1 Tax=Paenibacillus mucilaginosus (strain KNP414) TaxID=1036673 RepID=F8FCR3_PAEMK|nr:hypothetical protein KNP414_01067 [Paenibacillus mucilaginosus KNP414]